jgi:hypothetical protein
MADFVLWATACETAFWPAGTFMLAYDENRRAAIEGVVEADPVADRVREMMAKATTWTGSASDLYRIGAGRLPDGCPASSSGWPKSPRCRPAASRPDPASGARHRNRLQPRGARGSADHPDNGVTRKFVRKHRQYRQHRQRSGAFQTSKRPRPAGSFCPASE